MRQHTSDDHLVDEHAPRVAIAVVIDVGYLRIAFQLGIPQLPPVCEGKTVPHVQPYSCMYVCTTLVWLSMGDARVFLCSMPFRASSNSSSYARDHGQEGARRVRQMADGLVPVGGSAEKTVLAWQRVLIYL